MKKNCINLTEIGIRLDWEKGILHFSRWENGADKEYESKCIYETVRVNSWPETWPVTCAIPAGTLVGECSFGEYEWQLQTHAGSKNLECDGDSLVYIQFIPEAPWAKWYIFQAKE